MKREPEWAGKTGFGGHFRRIMLPNAKWVLGMLLSYFTVPVVGAILFINIFVDEDVVRAEERRRFRRGEESCAS